MLGSRVAGPVISWLLSASSSSVHLAANFGVRYLDVKNCPRCTFPLATVVHKEIELDHCRRCGGSYLSPEGGSRVFGPFVDPEVWTDSEIAKDLGRWTLRCPDDGTNLKIYSVEFEGEAVEIDLCPTCRGIWLDSQEGIALREIVMDAGQTEGTGLAEPDIRTGPVGYIFQLISQFPLEVWNPVHDRPRATLGLIGVMVLMFIIQTLDQSGQFTDALALYPERIFAGRSLWGVLTAVFLHADIIHLAGNAYYLYVFGDNVEDFLGSRRFLALFFASALAGTVLQVLTQSDPSIPNVGASAGVAGTMAAYLVLFPRVKIYQIFRFIRFRVRVVWFILIWFGWNLAGVLLGSIGVAWAAHIGGLLSGALFAYPYRARPLSDVFGRRT